MAPPLPHQVDLSDSEADAVMVALRAAAEVMELYHADDPEMLERTETYRALAERIMQQVAVNTAIDKVLDKWLPKV